jgi:hypothetical protein
MRTFFASLLLVLSTAFLAAQTPLNVVITSTVLAGGGTGRIVYSPVVPATGAATSYRLNNGSNAGSSSHQITLTNGASTFNIVDTLFNQPSPVCFNATVYVNTNSSTAYATYPCLYPHYTSQGGTDWCSSGTCNLDTYIANLTALVGSTGGMTASVGKVGEIVNNYVVIGNAVSLVTGTPKSAMSITLSAGDWDIAASLNYVAASATISAGAAHEISINSGAGCTTPAQVTDGSEVYIAAPVLTTTSGNFGGDVPIKPVNIASTTTYCIIATGTFTAGTESVYGDLIARRRR